MSILRFAVIVPVLFASAVPASGGAWTLERGHWQAFTGMVQSDAGMSFDDKGRSRIPINFHKLFVQSTFEYGLTGALTLFATPNYVMAKVASPTARFTKADSASVEAGARLLLFGRTGKLSLQTSYKTAGSFDLSVSANRASGRQIEVRLLYGRSFKLLGRDGFADIEVAQRWIARPRPNETPIDLTAGLWLSPQTMVMAQSFNTVSGGRPRPPYTYYRSHKIEISLLSRVTQHWSLQVGWFWSPLGQNALVERGMTLSLWTQV